MRKIIISLSILFIALCLLALGYTFDQDLEYEVLIFFLKWQNIGTFG
ncbi:MAG: hypothetical protein ACFFCM_09790 [Promethearchaeota archaeon]